MQNGKRIVAKVMLASNSSGASPITIDDNIINASFENLDRGNSSNLVEFGIYANRASLTFIDTDGIYEKLSSLETWASVEVVFYLYNGNNFKKAKTFIIEDFDFDESAKLMQMELVSKIIKWQEILIPKIYMFRSSSMVTLQELIAEINDYLSPIHGFVLYIDYNSSSAFERSLIYCPYIEPTSLWDIVSKICVFCGGTVYEDADGNAYLTSALPAAYGYNDDVIIQPKDILKISNHSPRYKKKDKYKSPLSILCKTREKYTNHIWESISYEVYRYIPDEKNQFTEYVGDRQSVNSGITITRLDTYWSKMIWGLTSQKPLYQPRGVTSTASVYNHPATGPYYFHTTEKEFLSHRNDIVNFRSWDNSLIYQIDTQTRYDGDGNKLFVMDATTNVKGDFFIDEEDEEKIYSEVSFPNLPKVTVPTNELFQTNNVYRITDNNKYDYSQVYLEMFYKTARSETLEIECLFTEYYNEEGELILSPNSKDITFFSRINRVRPFVIRNGEKVPFDKTSQNLYEITGIKYSYDGLLRQTLYLKSLVYF